MRSSRKHQCVIFFRCDFNFSVPVHLKKFGIRENDLQTWDGKEVTVFSAAQLGLYPYFVMDGQGNYNGGLPQVSYRNIFRNLSNI